MSKEEVEVARRAGWKYETKFSPCETCRKNHCMRDDGYVCLKRNKYEEQEKFVREIMTEALTAQRQSFVKELEEVRTIVNDTFNLPYGEYKAKHKETTINQRIDAAIARIKEGL